MNKEELISHLLSILDSYEPTDLDVDFVPYEVYGGNMDDAYYGGYDEGYKEGQVNLAEKVLKYLSTST